MFNGYKVFVNVGSNDIHIKNLEDYKGEKTIWFFDVKLYVDRIEDCNIYTHRVI